MEIDANGVCYEMREVLGKMCEWNSVENCKKVATRSKNVQFGARMRTQCHCNVSEMGSDGLQLMPEESAIKKLETFGVKYVSERLLKLQKRWRRKAKMSQFGAKTHICCQPRGPGRMADAKGGSQACQTS